MSEYSEFFLNSASNVVLLETIEISHPNMSKVYRVVRNNCEGMTAITENSESVAFEYYPLMIKRKSSREDLDQGIEITFGDLGEVLPSEIDLIAQAGSFSTKPSLIYRIYRSDDLTAPLDVIRLEITSIGFKAEGAVISADSPSLNVNKTGEIYSFDRFPPLRGVL